MSKIEVDQVDPQSGTTLTLGTSGDTVTIPSGVTITNNGTATGFGISWQSGIKTASFTAVAGEGYWVNTTSGAITITLPASASVGDRIIFTDYARTWGTNAVTVNQNSLNFQGSTSVNPVYNTNGQSVDIVYSGATQGWIPNSDDDVTYVTAPPVDAEYLVIGGGASGGSGNGGGGGAGGLLSNYGGTAISFTRSQVYTITVGAGGSSTSFPPKSNGNNGSDSVLSGSGITTITAFGGGYGGGDGDSNGADGGSGGGAYSSGSAGSGTPGQGNDGGTTPTSAAGGGGGGSGGAGGNGSSPSFVGGAGGSSSNNSITGSSVAYAGGGGGGTNNGPGDGGAAGGGGSTAGVGNPQGSSDATANSGSGTGGSNDNTTGAGGSGVVILRVATADYSAITTGSPTVTTDGSDTVIKYTGSGTYTA